MSRPGLDGSAAGPLPRSLAELVATALALNVSLPPEALCAMAPCTRPEDIDQATTEGWLLAEGHGRLRANGIRAAGLAPTPAARLQVPFTAWLGRQAAPTDEDLAEAVRLCLATGVAAGDWLDRLVVSAVVGATAARAVACLDARGLVPRLLSEHPHRLHLLLVDGGRANEVWPLLEDLALRARALTRRGSPKAALALLVRAPEGPESGIEAARAWLDLGRPERALESLRSPGAMGGGPDAAHGQRGPDGLAEIGGSASSRGRTRARAGRRKPRRPARASTRRRGPGSCSPFTTEGPLVPCGSATCLRCTGTSRACETHWR